MKLSGMIVPEFSLHRLEHLLLELLAAQAPASAKWLQGLKISWIFDPELVTFQWLVSVLLDEREQFARPFVSHSRGKVPQRVKKTKTDTTCVKRAGFQSPFLDPNRC